MHKLKQVKRMMRGLQVLPLKPCKAGSVALVASIAATALIVVVVRRNSQQLQGWHACCIGRNLRTGGFSVVICPSCTSAAGTDTPKSEVQNVCMN